MRSLIFLFLFIFSQISWAQKYIDLRRTLFGIEYSFQDETIVNEPGRSTMTTDYKTSKLNELIQHYMKIKKLPDSALEYKETWKPGYYLNIPGDGKYVINTEPVTIEFNTTPKTLSEIPAAAAPIYKAAHMAHLKPYVNPAAERSGMGHIHVGGRTLADSPFYQHENLLRNILAFFHKHPSLLYGFAEAYDVGLNSNIETLHETDRQQALKEIIAQYDRKIKQHASTRDNGLQMLLRLMNQQTNPISWTEGSGFDGFFAHYRFINLEHLEDLVMYADLRSEGKRTVEFRMFRPPPTAKHAAAMANLLVHVMDYLAHPGYLEKFESISTKEYNNFLTGSKIASDWEEVKNILKIENPLLDSMVNELVANIHKKRVLNHNTQGMEIFESYSEKEYKGKAFEIRLDASVWKRKPILEIKDQPLYFEKIKIGKDSYWITNVKLYEQGIDRQDFIDSVGSYIKAPAVKICEGLFATGA